MAELFLYGTFWFWTLTTAAIVIAFLFSENENGIGATICTLIYLGLLQWCSNVDPLSYAWNYPLQTLGWVAGYFVIGLVWATIKWILFLQDQDARKEDLFRDFKDEHNLKASVQFAELSAELKQAFDEKLRWSNLSRKSERFRDHLGDYTRWLGFWLFNMVYTALNDFVRRTARALARAVSRKMQAISDRINARWTD